MAKINAISARARQGDRVVANATVDRAVAAVGIGCAVEMVTRWFTARLAASGRKLHSDLDGRPLPTADAGPYIRSDNRN